MHNVSIIIPVYNAEKTLRKCVESIVYGAYRDVEVILVEDHSADGSWALCQELAQQFDNVRALRNDGNRGVSHTRNRGLEAATGQYILFCDSDDWVSGSYAQELLQLAENATDALPICGFHFLDQTRYDRQDYFWHDGTGTVTTVPLQQAFDVMDKVLLQQLWTKIFRRDVIHKHGLRFDEAQSMGEDFQFVLDYIQAGNITEFRILDKALYYYIRTSGSLMGKFGLVEQENEYARLETLRNLTGDDTRYAAALTQLRKNYVYHALRSSMPQKEKRDFAQAVLGDEAAVFFRQQQVVLLKERVSVLLAKCKRLLPRARGKLQRIKNQVTAGRLRRQLVTREISILSQNCIGGVLYHDMRLEFQSPTIDLYFRGVDFVRLAEDPGKYLAMEPVMAWDEEYPVGQLEDVQVRFMHYSSCTEALQAWKRRTARFRMDKLAVLCTDMEGFSPELFERWKKLQCPKVLFTTNEAYAHPNSVYYKKYADQACVPDLIPKREFYQDGKVMRMLNEFIGDR